MDRRVIRRGVSVHRVWQAVLVSDFCAWPGSHHWSAPAAYFNEDVFHSEDELPFWSSDSLQQLTFLSLLSFMLYAASVGRKTRLPEQLLSRPSQDLLRQKSLPALPDFSFLILADSPSLHHAGNFVLLLRFGSASLHPVVSISHLTGAR